MNSKTAKKARRFFKELYKNNRRMYPVAMAGLAGSYILFMFLDLLVNNIKKIVCCIFFVCFFFMGNSFAFPVFGPDNGFIGDVNMTKVLSASDSVVNLSSETVKDELIVLEEGKVEAQTEYGTVIDDEYYTLEDLLKNIDDTESVKDDLADKSSDIESENENIGFDASDWRLILINKQHPIPQDYEFKLGNINGYMFCDERVSEDLLMMLKKAEEEGVSLVVCSPYRNGEKQISLFERKIKKYMNAGYSYMDAYKISSQAVTVPGASEHEAGLAFDIITKSYSILDEGFENTEAGIWLKEHCADYGFILRYPRYKEYITGIEYEPWHFRYVGREAASIIMSENICLEEFRDRYL